MKPEDPNDQESVKESMLKHRRAETSIQIQKLSQTFGVGSGWVRLKYFICLYTKEMPDVSKLPSHTQLDQLWAELEPQLW